MSKSPYNDISPLIGWNSHKSLCLNLYWVGQLVNIRVSTMFATFSILDRQELHGQLPGILHQYQNVRIWLCAPPSCRVIAYNRANTLTSVLKKTWVFPIISLEKGSMLLTPCYLVSAGTKIKARQKYPYKLGQTPFDQQNISKVKHYF